MYFTQECVSLKNNKHMFSWFVNSFCSITRFLVGLQGVTWEQPQHLAGAGEVLLRIPHQQCPTGCVWGHREAHPDTSISQWARCPPAPKSCHSEGPRENRFALQSAWCAIRSWYMWVSCAPLQEQATERERGCLARALAVSYLFEHFWSDFVLRKWLYLRLKLPTRTQYHCFKYNTSLLTHTTHL